MIRRAEAAEWAAHFGVGADQIQRDHLISHVLAALVQATDGATRFYGGTALCRSYLDDTRLSEDIDLLHPEPAELLRELNDVLPRAMQREFPNLEWTEGDGRSDGVGALLGVDGLTPIRLGIRRFTHEHEFFPFQPTDVVLRYSDVPGEARLSCPMLESFTAMKMLAWYDRHAPRDLFDLWGLSELGALNETAESLLRRAAGFGFLVVEFAKLHRATIAAWETELGAQVGVLPSPDVCAARVVEALELLHP